MLEGIIKGNVATPYVNNTHTIVNVDVKNTNPFLLSPEKQIVNIGSNTPNAGIIHNIG